MSTCSAVTMAPVVQTFIPGALMGQIRQWDERGFGYLYLGPDDLSCGYLGYRRLKLQMHSDLCRVAAVRGRLKDRVPVKHDDVVVLTLEVADGRKKVMSWCFESELREIRAAIKTAKAYRVIKRLYRNGKPLANPEVLWKGNNPHVLRQKLSEVQAFNRCSHPTTLPPVNNGRPCELKYEMALQLYDPSTKVFIDTYEVVIAPGLLPYIQEMPPMD
jgi:hypothetical protein